MMLPIKAPRVPEWEALSPACRCRWGLRDLHGHERSARRPTSPPRVTFPFVAPPGSLFRYADLSGADGSLGTLDYGDDPGIDAFFVGRKVEIAELGIEGLRPGRNVRKPPGLRRSLPELRRALQLKDRRDRQDRLHVTADRSSDRRKAATRRRRSSRY